jgi:hypothetical protein
MRLLDRQIRLFDYLTSGRAIFGKDGGLALDQALRGIDHRLLRLEAHFSHQKRLTKIKAAFPNTFRLLGSDCATIVGEFAQAVPPAGITRIDNARQFYDFLCARWRDAPPEAPYLDDVAACEFALASVRSGVTATHHEPEGGKPPRLGDIRRRPDTVLLRCHHDIRPIFGNYTEREAPVRRDTSLVIAIPPNAQHPRIFEISSLVFEVLVGLGDWIDQSELGAAFEVHELIDELALHGLVEVHM